MKEGMFVCTKSGSIYEVDFTARMLRRLRGKASQALTDGTWKSYDKVVTVNGRLTFFWGYGKQQFYLTTTPVIAIAHSLGAA
jgi:hypothetical protein